MCYLTDPIQNRLQISRNLRNKLIPHLQHTYVILELPGICPLLCQGGLQVGELSGGRDMLVLLV